MPRALVAVVLHHARPVDVRHQRRVFEAHCLQELAGAQHQLVALLVQSSSLAVDALLKQPYARKSQREQYQKQPILRSLRIHFRFRREKTAAATSSTMPLYNAA